MHVGIIPDGNRRWATKRQAGLAQAYAIGFCKVIQITLSLSKRGVKELTFFGLSQDNYEKRPPDQVESILTRIIDSMQVAKYLLRTEGIQVKFVGALRDLGPLHYDNLMEIERETLAENLSAKLNILVNYSHRWDLQQRGYGTAEIPDIDFVFRSGGMRRLSGFLPIQSSEAELHFSQKLWPDVKPPDIERITFRKVRKNWGA